MDQNQKKFFQAAEDGDVAVLATLLQQGIPLESRNHDFHELTALNRAALSGRSAAVIFLLDKGADINTRDAERETPLINAAAQGHVDVVQILLERGADMNLAGENGTALQKSQQRNKVESIALLKEYVDGLRPDKIIFWDKAGDRTLEQVFNFTTLERLLLIRKDRYGPVEAVTCTGFSAIEDQSDESLLRRAFNEHVKRGGKTDEAIVFSRRLPKARLTIPKE